MVTPKRVWSNKKIVWDGKKGVWKVGDEIATYNGTWSKAEGQLTVYGNSWENLSGDDKLEVYDSSSATEIGTVEENQEGGGGDVQCESIRAQSSVETVKKGQTRTIGSITCSPENCTVNLVPTGTYEGIATLDFEDEGDGAFYIKATGIDYGNVEFAVTDTISGLSTDSMSFTVAGRTDQVEIDVAQSDLNPTVGNNGTIKLNNMPGAFTISWSPDGVCSVSEIDQANSSIIYTAETEGDCTFTITDNTDNANTASCSISVQPDRGMAIIFESSESQSGNADLEYQDTGETPTWYLPEATCLCKLVGFEGITDPETNISFQYLDEGTGEHTPTDLYLSLQDIEAAYPYCVMGELSTSIFSGQDGGITVDVIYTDPNTQEETQLGTLDVVAMPTSILWSDAQDIKLTQNGSTWTGTTCPFQTDGAPINPETQINFRYEDGEGNELDFVTAQIQANEDVSTMDGFPWMIKVTVDGDAAAQKGITLDDSYAITVIMLRSYDNRNIDMIPCTFPASE